MLRKIGLSVVLVLTQFLSSEPSGAQTPPSVAAASFHVQAQWYFDGVVGTAAAGTIAVHEPPQTRLTYTLAAPPRHGAVVLPSPAQGAWTYQPQPSFVGYDEFKVNVSDGHTSQRVRVVLTIHDRPAFRTYYVDAVHGRDQNAGTEKEPFATIQAAHDVTRPGDTVLIHNGTYEQTSGQAVLEVTRSGSPGAMIRYQAYPGEHPILHAETAWNHILVEASYIRIEGLEIAGNARNVSRADAASVCERFLKGPAAQTFGPETSAFETNGIFIRPLDQKAPLDRQITPRHVEIVGNRIHDVQGGGVSSAWADYLLFARNVIYDTSYRSMYATSGISVLGSQNTDEGSSDYKIVVRDNLLYRNRTEVKWAQINALSDGNGIIIDSNRNEAPRGEPYTGRMLIANNIVYESGGAGIQVYSSDHVDVLYNTVLRNSLTPGFQYGQLWVHQASNVLLENNVAVAGEGELINQRFKDTANVVYDYNLYYGGKPPEIVGQHDLVGDPKFVDAKSANFHLAADSPGHDSGDGSLMVEQDFAGQIRKREGPVDRGAFQH